jgi:hypothetical protein
MKSYISEKTTLNSDLFNHWIKFENFGEGDLLWNCSNCDFDLVLYNGDPKQNEYYFCPRCGKQLEV